MSHKTNDTNRRRFLHQLTQGAAAGAAAFVTAPRLFAAQFLKDAPTGTTPPAQYDPVSQVLVDPETRQPVYSTVAGGTSYKEWTAIVTPGPSGPTGDGKWDTYKD